MPLFVSMRTDRKFELLLYPDSTSYDINSVLLKAQKYFHEWAYILHDCDKLEDGSSKKAHIHFLGRNDITMTPSGVCYHLGLRENDIANIKSWKGAIRYLTHIDYPDKAKYDVDAITSNFNVTPYFTVKEDDSCQAALIFGYIQTYNPTLEQCIDYCINNQLWSAFRRGFAVWAKFINFNTLKEKVDYESNRYPKD